MPHQQRPGPKAGVRTGTLTLLILLGYDGTRRTWLRAVCGDQQGSPRGLWSGALAHTRNLSTWWQRQNCHSSEASLARTASQKLTSREEKGGFLSLKQWSQASQCSNPLTVSHVVGTPNHKMVLLLPHNCWFCYFYEL